MSSSPDGVVILYRLGVLLVWTLEFGNEGCEILNLLRLVLSRDIRTSSATIRHGPYTKHKYLQADKIKFTCNLNKITFLLGSGCA